MIRYILALALLCASYLPTLAADRKPAAAPAPQVDHEARVLVEELLSLRPAKEIVHYGYLNLRLADRRRIGIPLRHAIELTSEGWREVYETKAAESILPEKLVVVHRGMQPNQYLYGRSTNAQEMPKDLAEVPAARTDVPFADSEYWLSDLGLEFLHWPEQRLVRNAKITMRLGRPCKVLESIHPHPTKETYSRVVSWVDAETGALIYAESYDVNNKRFKVFSLRDFSKVNGQWQPGEFQIRNLRTDAISSFEFKFQQD